LTTLRYLLSLAAQNQWNIDHLDVVTAFLNPDIDAEVYMQIPDGIEWLEAPSGFTSGCRFLRLNKALYGLVYVANRNKGKAINMKPRQTRGQHDSLPKVLNSS